MRGDPDLAAATDETEELTRRLARLLEFSETRSPAIFPARFSVGLLPTVSLGWERVGVLVSEELARR
jgi:hypothetical protein